jgi:broad specificity phosphatase PhoE
MIFYFIRHGEKETTSVINEKIHQPDPALTKNGFEQAKSIITYFDNKKIDSIYSSEYLRVQQTARYLAEEKNKPIIIDKRLNEINKGSIETMGNDDIEKKFPGFLKDYSEHKKDFRYPGGETGEEVKKRQNELINEMMKENCNIVFFTHDGFIRILLCNILGLPVYNRYKFRCDYCGITELIYTNDEWNINRINYTTY